MKQARRSKLLGTGLCLLAVLCLATPASALALQDEGMAAVGAVMFLFIFLFGLAAYLFFCYCLLLIAKKARITENLWMAWIPILQIILMLNVARKPIWWIVLFLIPLVNIVIGVILWMAVAEARGKPSWWGILMILPVANLVALVYLAFSD